MRSGSDRNNNHLNAIGTKNKTSTKDDNQLNAQVETKDALLHAINEEYVEAVEVLAAFNMIMRRC